MVNQWLVVFCCSVIVFICLFQDAQGMVAQSRQTLFLLVDNVYIGIDNVSGSRSVSHDSFVSYIVHSF
jgi:hypothetical protein